MNLTSSRITDWIDFPPTNWKKSFIKYEFSHCKDTSDDPNNEKLLSITQRGIVENDISSNEGQIAESYDKYIKVQVGDISMNPMDLVTGWVDINDMNGLMSPAYYSLRNKNINCYTDFVKYLFQSNYQRKVFFKYGKGVANHDGAGRWVLTRDNLDNFCIYLPPIEEQKKICKHLKEKLLTSDQLREKIENKINLLELEKASITNQVVNNGLTSNNQFKVTSSKWIPKIPQHWSLKKLKHICIMKGRIGYRGYTEDDIVDEGEGAVTLSPSNIEKDIFKLNNLTYLSWEKYEESPEIQVFMNDILLVKTGSTIGKCCIVDQYDEEMTINPQLVVFKEIKIQPMFLYYFMSSQTYKNQILSDVSGGSTPTITQESILNHYIPLPDIEEQKMIVDYLDDKLTKINTAIDLEKKRINLLIEYKKTLISDAVTGKLKY